MDEKANTVIEALANALSVATRHNPSDVVPPAAVLWTDSDAQWQPVVAELRRLLPQLLTFGEYQPEDRQGPAIWLRTAIDGNLPETELPENSIPILYLPGVGRQKLQNIEECPEELKPLVELQYRGVCWRQKNGRDWTIEAFLVSSEGGLELDVGQDAATRQAMLGSLAELASTPIESLRGRRLEAEDFNLLLTEDPLKDLLRWLSDPESTKSAWSAERWAAFKAGCKSRLKFDPDSDGPLLGAELLGKRDGEWAKAWERFAEAPALYPELPERLRAATPQDLFAHRSSWPQNNEQDEEDLRRELHEVGELSAKQAREKVRELESRHGSRRDWVWAALGRAPLARALGHLVAVAEGTAVALGGNTIEDMAEGYTKTAWKSDLAALDVYACAASTADSRAVAAALHAIYQPWLASGAEAFQALVAHSPLPTRKDDAVDDIEADTGCIILFVDGLRFDVSQRLTERLRQTGCTVSLATRWAALPTVTATAKNAISPVAGMMRGEAPGEDFLPVGIDDGKPITAHRFRRQLGDAGYEYVRADETGNPAKRGWTENGDLDKLGHHLESRLALEINAQIDLILERIRSLLQAGWSEVKVVTDHGWLWLPGGLPKVALPHYLVESKWARCAAVKGGSAVDVTTVSWYWNSEYHVAVAPGIACFSAGHDYAHGGLSLQEALVPVLRVTGERGSKKEVVKIADITWAGLRCRIKVEPAESGLKADLRRRVNDPSASVSVPQVIDNEGKVSLLVADEDLQGEAVTAVILDVSGQVIAKQPTSIGGED